ncbi:TPA: restriction endonuclease subunit S [Providencia rettgeri]|uniref:restriction endonuclease subunit S n=1 Tax=Proteus mirabilis TaxID=584 RepID=UPI0018C55CB2|nr:restriction endonuclease subunit S [Proteus mirabilis]MCL0005908.1 restriction endonuclease subunit S [Providencia rettgeri]MBG2784151.1 restriction endonuclease subunit S [Proteus mirabilis]MBI6436681.1 restriction endonuclease subunit S [Proteus mirabilis]MCZ4598825.1 restriction endonuclease subunit S [Proteus mirabilis]MDF7254926.1 restriction endonuclease subunit S [Proteus mirabilis]
MNIVELGQISSMKYGKMLSKDLAVDEGFPVYSGYRITGYSKEYLYNDPMLIVVARGVGGTGDVKISPPNAWITNLSIVLELDDSKVDKQYLCYLLNRENLKDKLNSGAAQAQITIDSLAKYRIRLPPIKQQKKTAEFIAKYDDLIENNRRRIQLLEESARLLYQEWFVHLRFPGHEKGKMIDGVPEGWTKEPLENLLVLQRGFDLPISNRIEGNVPIYASTGINGFHNLAKVKGPGVVTGRSGSLGTVMYVAKDFWPLNTTLWVKEFKKASPIFATYLLRAMKLEGYNGGAAVPTLNRNDVHKVDVLCPESKLMNEFEVQVENIFKQIDKLKEYNEKLAQARDLLLPKLMSGELTV